MELDLMSHSVQDKGGLGLISMQERARLVHGEFSLETLPGRGADHHGPGAAEFARS